MKIFSVSICLLLLVMALYCCVESSKPSANAIATYTGTKKCQQCHPKEYAAYLKSDHFHAMDSAMPRSVRANFDNTYFVYFGDTTFFYQRNNQYYVRTIDSAGKKKEFQVSFTFGWQPLQQYLVQLPGGRIQSLPFCWDTRPKEQGGQKWFHIYGKEKILFSDELFWMGINQNWNNMCADCHTTNYQKNYDITSNNFQSKWSESTISCESCHGPASRHMEWTKEKSSADSLKGFDIRLTNESIDWVFNKAKGISYPTKIVRNTTLIETCARCHARASRLTDVYHYGESLLQSHLPSTINTTNYFIDGQIKEEDYEYGSFLQSKMYATGVNCIHCHEPHTMQLKAIGNGVCASCHSPEKFDVVEHTHHQVNSPGSMCANCHMPITNYMVIDQRRDHSIRIPRPDLSQSLNTPNACNKCHANQTVSWAAKYFKEWYGNKLPAEKTYGELLNTVSKENSDSKNALRQLLTANYPSIIMASAMHNYNEILTAQTVDRAKNFLHSPDPFLRLNALHVAENFPAELLLQVVPPLLNDPIITVRTEAMNVLLPAYAQLDEDTRHRFDVLMQEYLAMQRFSSDRPEGYLNQGITFVGTGRTNEAEEIYLLGLKRFPSFVQFYANLADLYRGAGQEARSRELLDKGLQLQPKNASLHYALGLWFIRHKEKDKALSELEKAKQLDPANSTFTYGYAIGVQSIQNNSARAVQLLENYDKKYGSDPLILNALAQFYQQLQQPEKASRILNKRKEVFGY
jgi:tetratricopeptide (TPR) repeat protein